MIRRISGVLMAVIFALLAALLAPAQSSATVYRVYEYFEGLPANYTPPDGQGNNFRETMPDITVAPPKHSLGAGDVTTGGTTYTCVGWKNGVGITPETGSGNSVTFNINSDVSITWVYEAARKLTIDVIPSQGFMKVWGANSKGQLGGGGDMTDSPQVRDSWWWHGTWDYVTAGAYRTSAAISNNGWLVMWGNNDNGQLGWGNTTSTSEAQWHWNNSGLNERVKAVAAGAHSTVAVRIDGTLWSWGWQNYGQLGNGVSTDSNVTSPQKIGTDSSWRTVAAGWDFALAIKEDGSLWGWGRNNVGQLGLGNTTNVSTPTRIGTDNDWKTVVAGKDHAAAIKNDGTLWLWGKNDDGQLGDNSMINRSAPVQIAHTGERWRTVAVGTAHTLAIREDGSLWSWGFYWNSRLGNGATSSQKSPQLVSSLTDWSSVAAGDNMSLAIKRDGTLWGWGKGTFGVGSSNVTYITPTQLGSESHWIRITAATYNENDGVERAMALRAPANNRLISGGKNNYGQLGNGNTTDTYTLNYVATGTPNDYIVLSGASTHSAAIRADGSLWTWGYNGYGQLGDNSTTDRYTPTLIASDKKFIDVSAGVHHTMAIRNDGSLWGWGRNDLGQLGNGGWSNSSQPVQTGTALDWRSVSAGWHQTLAIKNDGSLWAWGENDNGRLGYPVSGNTNQEKPRLVGSSSDKWRQAVAGVNRSAGIMEDGSLWLWGWNSNGQLGDGSTTDASLPKQIMIGSSWRSVAIGNYHTLAIREDGTLWAWGYQGEGRLGNSVNSTGNKLTPIQIGSDADWRSVSASGRSSAAIKTDGSLWVWGEGPFGNSTSGQTLYTAPTRFGIDNDWLQVAITLSNDKILAIRAPSRVETFPHLGTRILAGGTDVVLKAKVIPTNGTDPYFLSKYTGGSGNVPLADGASYQIPITLTRDTSVTWLNEVPVSTAPVTVGFIDGIPEAVQTDGRFFPARGTTKLATGQLTVTAPQEVTYINTTNPASPNTEVWELFGWTGTGDVQPSTGTRSSVTFTLSQQSGIVWKYGKRASDAVTFSFSVPAGGPVTNAEASFSLYKQSNTPGAWDPVDFNAATRTKSLTSGTPIRLTAKAMIVKNGRTYYCTGISVNSADYRSPITTSEKGDVKEFVLTLSSSVTPAVAWDLDVNITYAEATMIPMGQVVSLPAGCISSPSALKERVTIVTAGNASNTSENAFFWPTSGGFYPVRPVNLFTVTCDNNEIRNYFSDWGTVDRDDIVVGAPINLQPPDSPYTMESVHYSESFGYEQWNLGDKTHFLPLQAGRTLLRFSQTGSTIPLFVTMRAVAYSVPAATQDWPMATAITPPAGVHDDPEKRNGYVLNELAHYDGTGSDRAYDRPTRSGDIIPVNTNVSGKKLQDLVVVWYGRGNSGPAAQIGWPLTAKAIQYNPVWAHPYPWVVAAQGEGACCLSAVQKSGVIYNQPDRSLPGFNPNEEHAFMQGGQLHALRHDLNKADTSDRAVLLKYRDPVTGKWRFAPVWVFSYDPPMGSDFDLNYPATAGQLIQPPGSLNLLPPTTASRIKEGSGEQWYHRDHKGGHWAKASNGQTGSGQSTIVMQWYYPLQPGFYYPFTHADGSPVKVGDPVPFHNGGANHTDPPIDVNYLVSWPASAPALNIGETLTAAKNGLPAVSAMAAVKKIHDAGGAAASAAKLFAPFVERAVPMDTAPTGMRTEAKGGKTYFTDLPYALRSRLAYDPTAKQLIFKGVSIDTGTGEPLLLPNIMSAREKARIAALSTASTWKNSVDALYDATKTPLEADTSGTALALSAGNTKTSGYVVLAENDDATLGSAPVALHVIKVEGGPYQGEIKVIKSDNPFDEKLTLRHSGDFAGNTDNIYFTWYYQPDSSGIPPRLNPTSADTTGWTRFNGGKGVNEITIEGAGKTTLEDNWFMVRYYYGDDPATSTAFDPVYPSLVNGQAIAPANTTDVNLITNNWGRWAGAPGGETAQLAEGWIKRVTNDLNPLDARVADFRNNETNTTVSMLSQLGGRYNGAIALNGSAENLNSIGLIEAYQTVLDRGGSFTINSATPVTSPAAYNALLNAATRIAGFYTLLGNEAYNDTQDPTVGFDTRSGESGSMASSLFAFQNQTDSLLEEELALLRGRDNTTSTTRATPVYNRLIWNFTNGDGELAYVQTYNISDRNQDGFIDEMDAKIIYPQGHGDAWGHYLTAMTTWYRLLINSNFNWEPRAESILVGSSPVPVDYLDERKFAQTAAYKAHAGAEIVDLTYRKLYVDNPAGQWQGYKDNVTVKQNGVDVRRAWGVDDWARRAGQGAYIDWVTANAMLPATDSVNSGIQKIDRTTVPELKEISSYFQSIQFKADQADAGYSPLGLARGVVPFDLDPNLLVAGAGRDPQTHFEQVYGRAVKAVDNARAVYDYAANYSHMLRGNEDSLDAFRTGVQQQERSYLNQLIEVFGYPYSGDIGAGKTYPAGYQGPDIFHYNYMDVPRLTGLDGFDTDAVAVKATYTFSEDDAELNISREPFDVTYQINSQLPWKFDVPDSWGDRRAPGEIQQALSDLIRADAEYKKGLNSFAGALEDIERTTRVLEAKFNIKRDQIQIMSSSNKVITGLEASSLALKEVKVVLDAVYSLIRDLSDSISDGMPKVNGPLANDFTGPARWMVGIASTTAMGYIATASMALELVLNGLEFGAAQEARNTDLKVYINDARAEVLELAISLEQTKIDINAALQDLYIQIQTMQQAVGRYQAALAKGERILDERETFRKRTAAEIQDYRYQDLGFRTFRNEAVQKYRSTFDLAARYTYLAATAYDYETNLLRGDRNSGSSFLTDIVQQRSPGVIAGGVPMVGKAGLADPLARLNQNFGVYKTQLGFNNPQTETNPFSLRSGLFRIRPDAASNISWKNELRRYWVSDLNSYSSFKRYCRPFTDNTTTAQPGLVIPFTTEIRSGKNFFGFPLGSGDSAFDASQFATRIRSVGLWFSGYENAGLANTPRAYLVPAGMDVLRSPNGSSFEERRWQVVDQKLPAPFPLSTDEIAEGNFIPIYNSLSEDFGGIRRFSSIRAYNDPGVTGTSGAMLAQMNTDSSLVGRSVWNSQWLLIIPGSYLLDNPAAGLNNFINNVTDIRLLFQTYSYSGN